MKAELLIGLKPLLWPFAIVIDLVARLRRAPHKKMGETAMSVDALIIDEQDREYDSGIKELLRKEAPDLFEQHLTR